MAAWFSLTFQPSVSHSALPSPSLCKVLTRCIWFLLSDRCARTRSAKCARTCAERLLVTTRPSSSSCSSSSTRPRWAKWTQLPSPPSGPALQTSTLSGAAAQLLTLSRPATPSASTLTLILAPVPLPLVCSKPLPSGLERMVCLNWSSLSELAGPGFHSSPPNYTGWYIFLFLLCHKTVKENSQANIKSHYPRLGVGYMLSTLLNETQFLLSQEID